MAAATLVLLVAVPLGVVAYFLILMWGDRDLSDGFWRNFGIAFRRRTAETVSGSPQSDERLGRSK